MLLLPAREDGRRCCVRGPCGRSDIAEYPNPDLAIEIDISPPEVDREGIYKSLQVAEIWRFDGEEVTIEQLREDGTYVTVRDEPVPAGQGRRDPTMDRGRRFERPDGLVPSAADLAPEDLQDSQAPGKTPRRRKNDRLTQPARGTACSIGVRRPSIGRQVIRRPHAGPARSSSGGSVRHSAGAPGIARSAHSPTPMAAARLISTTSSGHALPRLAATTSCIGADGGVKAIIDMTETSVKSVHALAFSGPACNQGKRCANGSGPQEDRDQDDGDDSDGDSDHGELEKPGGVIAARSGGGWRAWRRGGERRGRRRSAAAGDSDAVGAKEGSGSPRLAEGDGVPAIGLVAVEEAEVVLVELRGRGPEAAGGLGLGTQDRVDAAGDRSIGRGRRAARRSSGTAPRASCS